MSRRLAHPPLTFRTGGFRPGTLEAIGYLSGRPAARHVVRTPGPIERLTLSLDLAGRPADRERTDLIFCHAALRDAHGTVVPGAWENVAFGVDGAARLVGMNPIATDAGIATILVETRPDAGPAAVYALAAVPRGDAVRPLGARLALARGRRAPTRGPAHRRRSRAAGTRPGRRQARARRSQVSDGGQRAAGSPRWISAVGRIPLCAGTPASSWRACSAVALVRTRASPPCPGPRGVAGRAHRGHGRAARGPADLPARPRRTAADPAVAAGLRVPRRPAAARRLPDHRHDPPVARRMVDPAVGRGGPRARPSQRAGGRGRGGRGAQPAIHPSGARLRRRRGIPLRVSRATRPGRVPDQRGAHRVRPGGQRADLVDPVELRPEGPLGDALLLRTGQRPGQRADPAHDADARRADLPGDPRGEPGGLRPDVSPRRPLGEPHAGRGPRPHGRRRQGARPDAVRDAVAHHPAGGQGHRSGALAARAQAQPAQCARFDRMDPSDEVRRHLVGHARRRDDLELGPEARRHDGQHAPLHRFRRGERIRRGAGRGVERGLGRRLDRQPRRLLVHPGLSRLRPQGRRGLRQGQGRPPDRAQRDLGRDRELRAPARQRLRAVPVARPRRDQVRIRHRPDQRGPLALLAVHGAALPAGGGDGGASTASCWTCTSRCTTPASGGPTPT